MILDAERMAVYMTPQPKTLREYLLAFYPYGETCIPPMDHVVRTARPMIAKVNGGVWKVVCECGAKTDIEKGRTAPGCVVWLSVPLGFCIRCLNQSTGRGWRPVTVPNEDVRIEIETILLCRPNTGDRNWEPTETVLDLLRQNREHGDPTPDDIEIQYMGAL